MAHSDPVHFHRLVAALQAPGVSFFAHIDSKADQTEFAQGAPENLHFVQERHSVAWGGISMIDALLTLFGAALNNAPNASHYILLTGSDYPLASNTKIRKILEKNSGRQLLKLLPVTEETGHYINLFRYRAFLEPTLLSAISPTADRAFRKILRLLRLPNRWPIQMQPYVGHTWCALTPECCRYIVDFHINNPWFYSANRQTFAADEHFFHTIIGNSTFRETATVVLYEGRGLWRFATTHYIDPSLQHWFNETDLQRLESSDCLFLRKVRTESSTALLDIIDKRRT